MWCGKCNQELSDCTCKDINERLQKAAQGGNFAYRSCTNCGKHYSFCKCEKPEWKFNFQPKGIKE
jgi:hypothetical protein